MRTENNQKNKEAFFALYWGQKVGHTGYTKGFVNKSVLKNIQYLELDNIFNISDMNLIRCLGVIGKDFDYTTEKDQLDDLRESLVEAFKNSEFYGTFYPYKVVQLIDFIRSIGYVIPYIDLSVQDLIDYGWVKLKD